MRIALLNPPWSFHGSIFLGCREPHLPIELGYAKALLEANGHDVLLIDAQLGFSWRTGAPALPPTKLALIHPKSFDNVALHAALETFGPELTAITTAPSYLFWRSAPPELRVPMQTLAAVRDVAGATIAIGPHASVTPGAVLRKLRVDVAVLGECEEVLVRLAQSPRTRWSAIPSTARLVGGGGGGGGSIAINGKHHATDLQSLPPLKWPKIALQRHTHHHQRFDHAPTGPGGEIEASRGRPRHCAFCSAKTGTGGTAPAPHDLFRKRPLATVLTELDAMISAGVRYVYFIDEIFVPDRMLLEALCQRSIAFGVHVQIDSWTPPLLELLGRAGCVSIEGEIDHIVERGPGLGVMTGTAGPAPSGAGLLLEKNCRLTPEQLTQLFVIARQQVPFVQANLVPSRASSSAASRAGGATTAALGSGVDVNAQRAVIAWREHLARHGVWATAPTPLFPYPGSPEYTRRFGACDDHAWERAHAHYLTQFRSITAGVSTDIQGSPPLPLAELERGHGG